MSDARAAAQRLFMKGISPFLSLRQRQRYLPCPSMGGSPMQPQPFLGKLPSGLRLFEAGGTIK
jgi:hypothetical protein